MLSLADVLDLLMHELTGLRRRDFPSRLSFRARASVFLSGMVTSLALTGESCDWLQNTRDEWHAFFHKHWPPLLRTRLILHPGRKRKSVKLDEPASRHNGDSNLHQDLRLDGDNAFVSSLPDFRPL